MRKDAQTIRDVLTSDERILNADLSKLCVDLQSVVQSTGANIFAAVETANHVLAESEKQFLADCAESKK